MSKLKTYILLTNLGALAASVWLGRSLLMIKSSAMPRLISNICSSTVTAKQRLPPKSIPRQRAAGSGALLFMRAGGSWTHSLATLDLNDTTGGAPPIAPRCVEASAFLSHSERGRSTTYTNTQFVTLITTLHHRLNPKSSSAITCCGLPNRFMRSAPRS